MKRETRAQELRHTPCKMEETSILAAPLGSKKEGFTQKWVSVSVRGTPTRSIERHLRQGWKFVPKDRCSNYEAIDALLSTNSLSSLYITNADTVLMEIPDELAKSIVNNLNKAAAEGPRNLSGVSNMQGIMNAY